MIYVKFTHIQIVQRNNNLYKIICTWNYKLITYDIIKFTFMYSTQYKYAECQEVNSCDFYYVGNRTICI